VTLWAAVFDVEGAAQSLLQRMSAAWEAEPNEGTWWWSRGPVALACKTPQSSEQTCPKQAAVEGSLAVVFDGRLDNRADLARKIQNSEQWSDPEVVLAAYRQFGEDCVRRFEGDYAFAVADAAKGLLLLARDVVGVLPLYYAATAGGMIAASRIAAILGVERRSAQRRSIARLLCAPTDLASEETFLQGVASLAPAHAVTAEIRGHRRWKYWEADPAPYLRMKPEACMEEFRTLFLQSVQRRTREQRCGVQLSGGIGSSSIACVAQQAGVEVMGLYHGGVEGNAADETAYLHLLEGSGVDVQRVPLLPTGYPASTCSAVAQSELPMVDEFPDTSVRVFSQARELNLQVVLSGTWGDQVLLPFRPGYLLDAMLRFRWLMIARHLRRRFRKQPVIARLLHPELRAETFSDPPRVDRWSSLNTAHARAVEANVRSRINTLAMERSAKASSAHGISVRFPFLDRDLITFLLAAPPEQQMPDGRPKHLLREALKGVVPAPILQWRDKGDYTKVVTNSFASSLELVFAELAAGAAARAGVLDARLFSGGLARLRAQMGCSDDELAAALGKLYGVECWLRWLESARRPH
jgi:asparagine synthase (glutamine-hydrolysing)